MTSWPKILALCASAAVVILLVSMFLLSPPSSPPPQQGGHEKPPAKPPEEGSSEEGPQVVVTVSGVWESIGPDGGDMHFVYATEDGVLFASHGFGGVWRSVDGGDSWSLICQDDFVDLVFLSMEEKDGVLYAGTNRGLWVSYDEGLSWSKVATGFEEVDEGIYVIPSMAFLGEKLYFTAVLDKRYRGRGPGYGMLLFMDEKGRVRVHPTPEGVDKEITVEARHPYLFLSSPYSGLYVFSLEDPKWVKILDANTTRVYVDDDYNLYVGTIGDWWYIGWKRPDGWEWEHVTVPCDNNTIFHFIVPDPVNEKRLWFGAGGVSNIYSFSARGSGNAFIGVGCWDGEWHDVHVKSDWAITIAFIGEETVETPCGPATKYALIPQAGKNNIQKTEDGGYTWRRSYNGIYADTINALNYISSGIWRGSIAVTAVSGTQVTTDMGDSWLEGVDFTLGRAEGGGKLPGYQWCVVSPDVKVKGIYDLIVSTGYPSPEGGDGVFGVDLSSLSSGGRLRAEKLIDGPHYEMVVLNGKLYAGSMESGVDVLDLESLEVTKIPIPGKGVLVRLFDGKIFIASYEDPAFEGDMWRWSGRRGKLYVYEDGEYQVVYDSYVASFFVNNSELIALSLGRLVYKPNVYSSEVVEVELPDAIYSDLAVDWDHGIIFLSTFDSDTPGVLWTTIDELREGHVELRPLVDGLLTMRVRNLLYVDGCLFAGTEGYSVWRAKLQVSFSEASS